MEAILLLVGLFLVITISYETLKELDEFLDGCQAQKRKYFQKQEDLKNK